VALLPGKSLFVVLRCSGQNAPIRSIRVCFGGDGRARHSFGGRIERKRQRRVCCEAFLAGLRPNDDRNLTHGMCPGVRFCGALPGFGVAGCPEGPSIDLRSRTNQSRSVAHPRTITACSATSAGAWYRWTQITFRFPVALAKDDVQLRWPQRARTRRHDLRALG